MSRYDDELREKLNEKYDIILQKYIDKIYFDDYEEINDKAFYKEMMYFVKNTVFPYEHFSNEDWRLWRDAAVCEFIDIAKERGDNCRYYRCPEAEEFCENLCKHEEVYENLVKYWQDFGKLDFEGSIDYDAFQKDLEPLVSAILPERFPLYRKKHLETCSYYLSKSFWTHVFEINDDRVLGILYKDDEDESFDMNVDDDIEKDIDNDININDDNQDISFAKSIASSLEEYGFEIELCPTPEDHHVDVIVRKNHLSMTIVCKDDISKVDSDTIEATFTESKYHKTPFRAVITNSGYTSEAVATAEHLLVLLLQEEDYLETIEDSFAI